MCKALKTKGERKGVCGGCRPEKHKGRYHKWLVKSRVNWSSEMGMAGYHRRRRSDAWLSRASRGNAAPGRKWALSHLPQTKPGWALCDCKCGGVGIHGLPTQQGGGDQRVSPSADTGGNARGKGKRLRTVRQQRERRRSEHLGIGRRTVIGHRPVLPQNGVVRGGEGRRRARNVVLSSGQSVKQRTYLVSIIRQRQSELFSAGRTGQCRSRRDRLEATKGAGLKAQRYVYTEDGEDAR